MWRFRSIAQRWWKRASEPMVKYRLTIQWLHHV